MTHYDNHAEHEDFESEARDATQPEAQSAKEGVARRGVSEAAQGEAQGEAALGEAAQGEAQGVSRRGFLQALGLGAATVAAAGALAACAPAGAGDAAGGGAGDAAGGGAGGAAGGGAGAAGGGASGLPPGTPPVEAPTPTETLDVDVCVIGGGASGCSSALRASEEGAIVALVEKTGALGGCFNLSWAACTVNSKYAPDDPTFPIPDVDAKITGWIADSHWRCDGAAIRQLLMTSGEAYDWLTDTYGLQLIPLGWGNGFMMLPDYATRPGFWMDNVTAATDGKGGKLLLNTTAKALVTDGSGAVVGVIVEGEDGTVTQINAKAVSISTGGYAGNYEMVKANNGFGGVNGSLPQNVGEGLAMAWTAGAWVPNNFGGQMLHQTLARATNDIVPLFDPLPAKYPMMVGYLPMLLNVGATGVRFRDEALTLAAVPAALSSAYQGPFHYVVLSKKIIDALEQGGLAGIGMMAQPGMPPEFQPPDYTPETPWADVYTVLDKVVELGFGFVGTTPEELAAAAGMDQAIFSETYANYLSFCAEGKDSEFNKAAEYLLDYGTEGPIYLIATEENNLGSFGGIQTSLKYQALNADRKPIPGLYATGAEAGSNLYNDMYVGDGIGLANTVTSGYLCGKAMADYAKG
jgi:fumarate reductase flavoprotein subunit